MADVVECSLDSRVAPTWILASHSDDQVGAGANEGMVSGVTIERDFGKGASSDGLAPARQVDVVDRRSGGVVCDRVVA